jgi:hypothetical protein
VLAAFSSRGPQTAVPDIAKPDVTAPGVNILAAASPTPASSDARPGEIFQSISGTSMASPHVAGLAALLTQLHPTWSAAALKSAIMTTADPHVLEEDGKTPATPFDAGSGRIDPARAADPGLVLDLSTTDYLRYLEGIDPTIYPGVLPPLASTDLNVPSLSFSSLTGIGTTKRTFTSVDPTMATWQVEFEGPPGITAKASPEFFRISPGQKQTVTFTLTRQDAKFDAYVSGAAVLTNRQDGRTVRLPITIQPKELGFAKVADLSTTAAAGSAPLTVAAGYTGVLSGLGWGLASPQVHAGETITSTSGQPSLGPDPGSKQYPVTVPAGSQLVAGEIRNADAGDPNTDLDLFLYYDMANGAPGFQLDDLVAQSAGPTATETIQYPFPDPGNYLFVVVGFQTKSPATTYDFTTWLTNDPSPDDPSNPPAITVTGDPVSVTLGHAATLTLNWFGVAANGTYYGLATYHDAATPTSANQIGYTVVRLTKTASTVTVVPVSPPTSPPPAVTPAPAPAPVLTPAPVDKPGATPAAASTAKPVVRSARVSFALQRPRVVAGRMLAVTVRTPSRATIQGRVTRAGKLVARTAVVHLKAGVNRVTIPLKPVLQRGTYNARLTVHAGTRRMVRSLRFRVG